MVCMRDISAEGDEAVETWSFSKLQIGEAAKQRRVLNRIEKNE